MCFVGFNFMPNLIVILFNLMYPVFVVGIYCKGCVIVRKSVKTQAIEAKSEACALHMTGMRRVSTGWKQLCLASISWVRPSRETFCFVSLCYLIHTFCTHTIYTHITHKCEGVLLRENPSQTSWELEIIIPIYLYTYACGFPQLLPLHFYTIEMLIAQTLTTPF